MERWKMTIWAPTASYFIATQYRSSGPGNLLPLTTVHFSNTSFSFLNHANWFDALVYPEPGEYYLREDFLCVLPWSQTLNIVVNSLPLPSAPNIISSVSVCQGSILTLTNLPILHKYKSFLQFVLIYLVNCSQIDCTFLSLSMSGASFAEFWNSPKHLIYCFWQSNMLWSDTLFDFSW